MKPRRVQVMYPIGMHPAHALQALDVADVRTELRGTDVEFWQAHKIDLQFVIAQNCARLIDVLRLYIDQDPPIELYSGRVPGEVFQRSGDMSPRFRCAGWAKDAQIVARVLNQAVHMVDVRAACLVRAVKEEP